MDDKTTVGFTRVLASYYQDDRFVLVCLCLLVHIRNLQKWDI